MANCEKHPEEALHKCCVCSQEVCGICDTYINPVTNVAISKDVWLRNPHEVKLVGMEWPKEPFYAHLSCAHKKGLMP